VCVCVCVYMCVCVWGGGLTRTEGVDVLVELEADDGPVVVDDVGLTVPGARHHFLSAVALERTHTHTYIHTHTP